MNAEAGVFHEAWSESLLKRSVVALVNSRAGWWAALGVVCIVLMVPLFLVDVPPLLDYPNHLARMYVLAFGAHDPILSRMYTQHWAIIPNLAIDLVLPALLHILPIYTAGRVILAATLLLPLAGTIVYHRVAFGERSFWPLTAALGAYNALFLFGFMNFLLSLGMALLAAAAWLRWRDRYPVCVTIGGALVASSIFFMHLFGLLFLGVLIASEELVALGRLRATGGPVVRRVLARGIQAAVMLAPIILLTLAAPIDRLHGVVLYRPLWHRLYCLAEPFLTYDGLIDGLTGWAVLVALAVGWRHRRLRATPGIGLALAVLFAGYLVCPFETNGTGFIDARLPIMLFLLVTAGVRPVALSPRLRAVLAAVLGFALLARTASLATVWFDHNRDLADFRAVTATVRPGSRVLVVSVDQQDAPAYWANAPRGRQIPYFFRLEFHLPALLTIEHHAFIPYLFTVQAKQPLLVRPPYDRISVPEGQPPNWRSLVLGYNVRPVTDAPYLAEWQQNFDYVLLLNAGGAGDVAGFLPDKLQLIAARDVAALYRIRRP